MINGYKMLKDTPAMPTRDNDVAANFYDNKSAGVSSTSNFRLPVTPLREEIGHKIANEAQKRKREKKALEKFNKFNQMGL